MSSLCVLVVSSYMALTPLRAQEVVETGNSIIGMTEKVRYIPMRNRYPIRYTESKLNAQSSLVFSRWRRYVNRVRSIGGLKCNVHVFDGPAITESASYAGGAALLNSACYNRLGFSLSNGREVNTLGLPRFLHSIRIYVHERLHTFGAEHNDFIYENMMNSYVMGDINAMPPILQSTRAELCKLS